MSLSSPDDRVGVVVDDDGDILVTLLVAGLIYAYVYKIVKTPGTFRLNDIQRAMYAPANGLPVYPHVLGYDTTRQIYRKPTYSKVKVLRKAAVRIRPRDVSYDDSVFRTLDTVCVIGYLHESASPIQPSPCARLRVLLVITFTTLFAKRTVIFMPAVGAGMDPDVVYTILIRVKVASFYDSTLDIEQFFT